MSLSTVVRRDLGPADRIPLGEGREFDVMGQIVAVFRSRNGQIYATQASCPHRGGPLADGLLGGATVICPLHARKFDLETGRSVADDCFLRTYPVYLDDNGHLILDFDTAELPVFEKFE